MSAETFQVILLCLNILFMVVIGLVAFIFKNEVARINAELAKIPLMQADITGNREHFSEVVGEVEKELGNKVNELKDAIIGEIRGLETRLSSNYVTKEYCNLIHELKNRTTRGEE